MIDMELPDKIYVTSYSINSRYGNRFGCWTGRECHGYAYIRMPLPAACGMPYCLLGIRTEDNRVSSVRCALPGPYAPTPPQGLEGSVWIGAGDGGGYWVFTVKCGTD